MKFQQAILLCLFWNASVDAISASSSMVGQVFLKSHKAWASANELLKAEEANSPAGRQAARMEMHKHEAKHMMMLVAVEKKDAAQESVESHEEQADAKAIEKVAALSAKFEMDRGRKELKDKQDLIALNRAVQLEKDREDKDAEQLEDVAAKEEKDVLSTNEDVNRTNQDATKLEAQADTEFQQLKAQWTGEQADAKLEEADAKAIGKAAALQAKFQKERAQHELKDQTDMAALQHAVQLEQDREDQDAKQLNYIASKEEQDAAATERIATRSWKA